MLITALLKKKKKITALLTHEFLKVWSKDGLNQNYSRSLAKNENYRLHSRLPNLLSGNGASKKASNMWNLSLLTFYSHLAKQKSH